MMHLLFLLLVPLVRCDTMVQTNSGPIRGISIYAKNVDAFLGIPYAEAPVGNLRFARPVPISPWTETLDAKKFSPVCVQGMIDVLYKFYNDSVTMDEDCLYLNVWAPKSESTLKPVMVFIHGGGFMVGTANVKIYDGATLAQYGDVIVVSMNYRVGSLGFFSAFNDDAAGNMGMLDQVLAIQWIKDNAKHFGGDPDNIVLFGQSAGSWSISLHLLSPLSKNLFNRAILQSGAAINPIYSSDNKVLHVGSQRISKFLGCATDDEKFKENSKSVVECMKSVPFDKFSEADEELLKSQPDPLIPRVGDDFLPDNPTDILRKGGSKDTEILLGVTRDEGTMFIAFQPGLAAENFFGHAIDASMFNESSIEAMIKPLIKDENYDKIAQKYLKRVKEESRYTYLNALSDFIGDPFITCPTTFFADFHSMKNPTYFYVFDYRSPSSPFAEWMGVPHFEEVQYVFGVPYLKEFSENEEELSKDIMDMWIAFAKSGNPNIPGGLKWPKYTYEDPQYLLIGMRDRVGVKPANDRCEEWRSLYRTTVDDDILQNFRKSSG